MVGLLFDTGYLFHQEKILHQLKSILDPDTPLSIIPLRINEFMSVGNVKAITYNFNVWHFTHHIRKVPTGLILQGKERDWSLKEIPTNILRGTVDCMVGDNTDRNIQVISAPKVYKYLLDI